MPDQPADPIHYEMKIPPEPKHADEQPKPEKPPDQPGTPESGDPTGTGANRNENQPDRR